MNSLPDSAIKLHPELTPFRRDIHAHPELGFEERKTPSLMAAKLREWGLDVVEGVGKIGVVGTFAVAAFAAGLVQPAVAQGRLTLLRSTGTITTREF